MVFISFQEKQALKWSVLERLEIKNFLRHQRWWGQGLGSLDNLCIPEPVHYLAPPTQIQILYWTLKV